MISISWNDIEMTTISEIAEHYSNGNKQLAKDIKPFIRTGVNKISTTKLTKAEIEKNLENLKLILPARIPPNGITLIKVSDIPSIEKYFISVLKQKSSGSYKIDRFLSKRQLIDELKLEIKRKKLLLTSSEFSSVLSYVSRLELGQPKVESLRHASKKFSVTQKRIKDILNSLELQIDYKNKPKDYI